jgi:TOBE domain
LTPEAGRSAGGTKSVEESVRPQSIGLSRDAGKGRGGWVEGREVKRAYRGEYWDCPVVPGAGGPPLRVTALSTEVFEIEEHVWLEIDPRRVADIPEEP